MSLSSHTKCNRITFLFQKICELSIFSKPVFQFVSYIAQANCYSQMSLFFSKPSDILMSNSIIQICLSLLFLTKVMIHSIISDTLHQFTVLNILKFYFLRCCCLDPLPQFLNFLPSLSYSHSSLHFVFCPLSLLKLSPLAYP